MRNRLVSVAIEQFGEHGFDGASTRDIAAQAGTTMSNITYHFGSKEGLYRAAAESIVIRFREVACEVEPDEADADADPVSAICAVLRAIGTFMLSDEAASMARFVAREQQNPASPMREFFRRDFQPMGHAHAEQIRKLKPGLDERQSVATFFYLASMAISLRSSRLSLCTVMDVEEIDEDLTGLLLDRLEAIARDVLEARA